MVRTVRIACVFLALSLASLQHISDAQSTWKKVYQFTGKGMVSAAHFFDRYNGVIGFQGGTTSILRTTDGGVSWLPVISPPATVNTFHLTSFFFKNNLEGWASHYFDQATSALWYTL